MSQGLRVRLGVMIGMAAFAILIAFSPEIALVAGLGFALSAAAVRWPDQIPKLGLYLIVAFVPLSFVGGRLPLPFFNSLPKVIFPVAFGALLVGSLFSKRRFVMGSQGVIGLLFAGLAILSYLLNEKTVFSFQGLMRPLNMVLLLLLALNVLKTGRDVAILFVIMVSACLVSAVGGMLLPIQWAPGYGTAGTERMSGWTYQNDAPTFGIYLVVSTLICFYHLLTERRTVWRLVLLPVAGLLVYAIMLTYARGAVLVLLLSMGFMLFRLRRRLNVIFMMISLIGITLVVVPRIPDAFYARIKSGVSQYRTEGSIQWRIDSARIGLDLFMRSPLVGRGPGNFLEEYLSNEFRFDRPYRPGSVIGNTYVAIAYSMGVLGLGVLVLFAIVTWRNLRYIKQSYAPAAGPPGRDDGDDLEPAAVEQGGEILEILFVALLIMAFLGTIENEKLVWIFLAAAGALGRIRRDELKAVLPVATPGSR